MNIIVENESWGRSNLTWLGSAHASNEAQTVTLDVAKFADFGEFIPAGVPLKQGENGLYEPVAAAADALAGFLLTEQPARGQHQVAPMIWHGRIKTENLPEKAFDVTTLTNVPGAFTFTNTTNNTEVEG